jgi:hypothetical protein
VGYSFNPAVFAVSPAYTLRTNTSTTTDFVVISSGNWIRLS